MGRFFEDFQPGMTVTTATRTMHDADVTLFAGLTGDLHELHLSDEYATTTPFGRRIVHGALVFSLSVGLTSATGLLDGTLLAFSRVDHLRFARPVFIGDTIVVTKIVMAAEAKGARQGLLAFDTRVRNQHGDVVLAYIDKLLVSRRAADPRTEPAAAIRTYDAV
jgi:3-hydroxybutyryl-CoA dehydratase